MSKLPRDGNNTPIPVLSLKSGAGHVVPYTSSVNTSPMFSNSTTVVTVYATTDAFIEVGNTATCTHFLPASTLVDLSLGRTFQSSETPKVLTVISESEDGILYVSERS
jgi:hypothetical protein